ncbi:MAG: tetratricopeptide repeat protein [Vicinamibacterales bacterium]
MSSRVCRVGVLLVVTCAAFPATTSAHGDLHTQILAATAKITRDPANPALYLERGAVYREHREWARSLADCDRALTLNPQLTDAALCRGLTLAASGRYRAAERVLNSLLTDYPDIVSARIARARTLVALRRPIEADPDYAAALSGNPNPDWYLERAHALHQAREPRAIAVLDEAIAALGPLVTLQDFAVELDLEAKRYDAALARVDLVISRINGAPAWLLRRAQILEQAHRSEDAAQGYLDTIAAITALPPARRHSRAMADLIARAQAGVARVRPAAGPRNNVSRQRIP